MVLRAIEQKIEALFEGVFGRAFRTNVQPVELARKLAKEMDDHRTVSVSRVYVPNEYTVYLSAADHEQFTGYQSSLVGEFGIATRMVQPRQSAKRVAEEPEGQVEPGATMIYKPRAAPVPDEDAPPP